jgi:hypothetical protein
MIKEVIVNATLTYAANVVRIDDLMRQAARERRTRMDRDRYDRRLGSRWIRASDSRRMPLSIAGSGR